MNKAHDEIIDVVIVGAGLAGLAAAHSLEGFGVALIEREPQAGGRVLTVTKDSARFDLGACFAYNPHLLPGVSAAPTVKHEERASIGIHMHGTTVFADTAWSAVRQLPIAQSTLSALASMRAGTLHVRDLPPEAARILRALFQQIHPADITEYSALRHGDAWNDWYPDHWREGNIALVDAYATPLAQVLRVGANVTRVEELADHVLVTFERHGSSQRLRARAVIVATPATVARQLVRPRDPACATFLGSVRYGRYTVVAFVAERASFPRPFRFIITPEAGLTFVMSQQHAGRNTHVLLCYYAASDAAFADARDDRALIDATRSSLEDIGFAADALEAASTWVKRWPLSGTILDDRYFALKRPDFARASTRTFLAGDYLAMTPGWGYGMDDAVASGRSTGALVRDLLAHEL